jgi:hypothetical protein
MFYSVMPAIICFGWVTQMLLFQDEDGSGNDYFSLRRRPAKRIE